MQYLTYEVLSTSNFKNTFCVVHLQRTFFLLSAGTGNQPSRAPLEAQASLRVVPERKYGVGYQPLWDSKFVAPPPTVEEESTQQEEKYENEEEGEGEEQKDNTENKELEI